VELLSSIDYRIARINKFPPRFIAAVKAELDSNSYFILDCVAEVSLWDSRITFFSPNNVADSILYILSNGFTHHQNDKKDDNYMIRNFIVDSYQRLQQHQIQQLISGDM